jgi:hypothetical protein
MENFTLVPILLGVFSESMPTQPIASRPDVGGKVLRGSASPKLEHRSVAPPVAPHSESLEPETTV